MPYTADFSTLIGALQVIPITPVSKSPPYGGYTDSPRPPTAGESELDVAEDANQRQDQYQGKYSPLKDHLRTVDEDEIEFSFSEIEDILGFTLPNSTHKYDA